MDASENILLSKKQHLDLKFGCFASQDARMPLGHSGLLTERERQRKREGEKERGRERQKGEKEREVVVFSGYYFEKKRAFATGVSVCGSGAGTFVLAPLASYLLQVSLQIPLKRARSFKRNLIGPVFFQSALNSGPVF